MKRSLPWVLVAAQFALLAGLAFVPQSSLWPVGTAALIAAIVLVIGGGVVALLGARGLGPALTATPVPKEKSVLVTTGLYSQVRHPIYTGLLIAGLGLVVLGSSVVHIVLWLALLVLLAVKARWEERMLAATYPDYVAYAATTGRFIPGVGRRRPGQS
jgi:protein-S-isoprenylcysteine O-methyltransferase Ste14